MPTKANKETDVATKTGAESLLGKPILYYPRGGTAHAASVISTHYDDPDTVCLTFYCPATHVWKEVYNVKVGSPAKGEDRDYCVPLGS